MHGAVVGAGRVQHHRSATARVTAGQRALQLHRTMRERAAERLPRRTRVAALQLAPQDAAALSLQDPRERPAEAQAQADQLHARFADEQSDFVAFLNLWRHLREQQRELSGNQFRKRCRAEYLHYLRVREWKDLVGQLRSIARDIGVRESDEPAQPAAPRMRRQTKVTRKASRPSRWSKSAWVASRPSGSNPAPAAGISSRRPTSRSRAATS